MAKRKILPSQDYLQARLRYDAESGLLFWRPRQPSQFKNRSDHAALWECRRWNTRFAGKKAGRVQHFKDHKPYYLISIDNTLYQASRVIYKMITGLEPENIDHVDCNTLNNRIENLRPATSHENCFNRGASGRSKLGVKGVHKLNREIRPYKAVIGYGGKLYFLGNWDTLEEAKAAYAKAAAELHGDFARTEDPYFKQLPRSE